MPMQPGSVSLDPTQATRFLGSDGRFEIDVPDGAVSAGDLAAAGGQLNVSVRQIAPASGGTGGGGGRYSFGTYLVQVVTAQKQEWQQSLRKPLAFKLHVSNREQIIDLSHVAMTFNGAIPADTNFNPDPSGPVILAAQANLSKTTSVQANFDPTNSELVATELMPSDPIVAFNTDSPDATFGRPDQFNADVSAAGLTSSYPIDVPSGPGGFKPPIQLVYDSGAVNEQHNPQGAAPWVGEGWNLTMGSISWAEHNVAAGCERTATCGSDNWEDSWQLNDPYGTAAELVPPNPQVTTYYDSTPYSITATPVQWHAAPETHAKVFEYTGTYGIPGEPVNPPCFRVFLPNGIMEEFGCSSDNGVQPLQYFPWSNTSNYGVNQWLLDLITDPQGNQIHLNYQIDTSTYNNKSYPRDIVLSSVEWDDPTCHNAQSRCTTWNPLMRITFQAGHSVAHVSGSSCAGSGNLRCDDPVDLSGSGGLANPRIQSTFVLNDLLVQTRSGSTGSWNTLRDYQLSYDQSPQTTATEQNIGASESVAGKLTLTQILAIGDDGTTALPARNFGYTSLPNWYTDEAYQAASAAGCGPSWNTPCHLWSTGHGGNSWFMTSASNGFGLAQTFTWSWARNNTHGVNGGGTNNINPLYCPSLSTTAQGQYPCDEADSQNWSRMLLTQESDSVVQAGATLTTTRQYVYTLASFTANPCSDCLQGYTWGNQKDGDYADYYNAHFMGFAQVNVTNPDGSVEVHKFHSTLGWGVYDCSQVSCAADGGAGTTYCFSACHNDPWWPAAGQSTINGQNSIANLLHGHEYEADYLATNGTTKLQEVDTQYVVTCPPTGVSGSPQTTYGNWDGQLVSEVDPSNPVGVCDIQTAQTDDKTYDGSSSAVDRTTQYSYDSYGRVVSETDISNDGAASAATTTVIHHPAYVYNDNVTATSSSVTGSYLVNFRALNDIEDASGNRYACTYTSYDGAAWTTGSSSSLTLGESTRVDHYTFCGTTGQNFADRSGPITTTASYDAYGNRITGKDADANAGNSAHVGCIVNSATYSECLGYDSTFDALPISAANALNQTMQTGYQAPATATAAGGFGLWPISSTDANSQTTSYGYDALGRPSSETLPNETSGLTTVSAAYTDWCSGSGAQSPCVEIDKTQRLNSTTVATSRYFYDGWGHLVETRIPGPNSQDAIQVREYDTSGRLAAQSVAYFVSAYTGGPGSAAFSAIDTTKPVTSYSYDGLGRVTSTTDPLSNKTATSYSVACASVGGDSSCYEQTLTDDPLGHQRGALVDGFGREDYAQLYSGNGPSTYAVYATSRYSHDPNGQPVEIAQPSSVAWPTSTPGVSDAGPVTPGLSPGLYQVNYTYVTGSGESAPSPPGWVTLSASGHGITFASITGIPAGVSTVKVYLTSGPAAAGLVTNLLVSGGTTSSSVIQGGGNGVMPPLATMSSFDMTGRKIGLSDPDAGTTTATYDQDGNVLQSVDARGSAGTVYAGYDGLDRPVWRNSTNSASGAFDTYGYDSTASGNDGVGRLTSETFSGAPNNSLSGSYAYAYDARGQQTSRTLTVSGTGYPLTTTYDDAGNTASQVYPTGETVSYTYQGQGWLTSVSQTRAGGCNPACPSPQVLLDASYGGYGGAAGFITGGGLGPKPDLRSCGIHYYGYSATYDARLQATDMKMTYCGSTTYFDESRTFDGAGNVTTANTTLPAGTDNQAFCYDEQNRLTWAGSTGTPPCGVSLTPGSLTTAQYTQSFAYDALARLTSGPLGTYTYGDPSHLHAATAIGSTYTAAYDAAGNMSCRAPSSATTCAGTPTGAPLTYDPQGRLSSWQNAPSSPTSTAGFLYDGQGNRVVQQSTNNGTTTTTVYVGNLEEAATTGSSTTTTTYYYAKSWRFAEAVNGSFTYLASDGLGSAEVALSGSSPSATASLLYAPYGTVRYSSGTMPTDYGFTGQHSDSTSGLDYYNARYYDPVAGQFTSADTLLLGNGLDILGLSRYAYVQGNPENRTDPSGNLAEAGGGSGCEPYCATDPGSAANANTAPPHEDSHTPSSGLPSPSRQSNLITQHQCVGRCQIIMQILADANPPGDPYTQWYEEQLQPDLDVLSNIFLLFEAVTGLGLVRSGPGRVTRVPEEDSMPDRAAAYQAKWALPRGYAYKVNGIKFDDYRNGSLIETKGPGYAWAVDLKTMRFRTDFEYSGATQLLEQAARQVTAAPQGTPIVWYVAEQNAATAIRNLFADNGVVGINVIWQP